MTKKKTKPTLNDLEFCPTSVNKKGHRRWFQSKHSSVNNIIEGFGDELNMTFSKGHWEIFRDLIEKEMGLDPTTNEE